MDTTPSAQGGGDFNSSPSTSNAPSRKRSTSGSGGLMSRFPFMRSTAESHRPHPQNNLDDNQPSSPSPFDTISPSHSGSLNSRSSLMSQAIVQQPQQQKTRRRRGSLRKVALLGRGAQREARESRSASTDITQAARHPITSDTGDGHAITSTLSHQNREVRPPPRNVNVDFDEYGLGISDITPRPSTDGFTKLPTEVTGTPLSESSITHSTVETPFDSLSSAMQQQGGGAGSISTSPAISYSTTDDEDALHMGLLPVTPSLSSSHPLGLGVSGVPSHALPSIQRRRSTTMQRPKSPLALPSLAGLSTTPLPPPDADWDYSETEWWGWVVLVVTWIVFVTGMGSCLGVWSWAWDVGTTPYAPPELEDDPTLPIVGYYPALIILTGVMAWVWVVVAWVGMKYFRHARVSGD